MNLKLVWSEYYKTKKISLGTAIKIINPAQKESRAQPALTETIENLAKIAEKLITDGCDVLVFAKELQFEQKDVSKYKIPNGPSDIIQFYHHWQKVSIKNFHLFSHFSAFWRLFKLISSSNSTRWLRMAHRRTLLSSPKICRDSPCR